MFPSLVTLAGLGGCGEARIVGVLRWSTVLLPAVVVSSIYVEDFYLHACEATAHFHLSYCSRIPFLSLKRLKISPMVLIPIVALSAVIQAMGYAALFVKHLRYVNNSLPPRPA